MNEEGYVAPDNLDAAVSILTDAGGAAKLMAGGTDVIVQLHAEMIEPGLLVDIKNIPELRTVSEESGGWRVGAAVPCMELMDNVAFCNCWPGVVEGLSLIGSVQVKARASLGGNLCNASPAADSVPAMMAAGAVATIIGPNGWRDAPVEDIVTGPGKTSLGEGEIVVSFLLPPRPAHSGDCYLRLTPRTEMDIAVVGVGVNLTLDDDGVCINARVALGAVAPTQLLVKEAADALIGTKVDKTAIANMAVAASAACKPISDKRGTKEYRIKIAAVMARRAAEKALERAQEN